MCSLTQLKHGGHNSLWDSPRKQSGTQNPVGSLVSNITTYRMFSINFPHKQAIVTTNDLFKISIYDASGCCYVVFWPRFDVTTMFGEQNSQTFSICLIGPFLPIDAMDFEITFLAIFQL